MRQTFASVFEQAFVRALVVRRAATAMVLPTPTFGIRMLYGEMGVTLATASQRVVPDVLTEAGFTWEDTDVRSPLREALA